MYVQFTYIQFMSCVYGDVYKNKPEISAYDKFSLHTQKDC